MGVYRSTNLAEFDDVDGIIVNETAPPPSIKGAAANTAILVGDFERGPINELKSVGSIGEFQEIFGKGAYTGNAELKQRRFGRLKIIRAAATAIVKATKTFQDVTPEDAITFEALYSGLFGNSIKVTIEDGSDSGKKYTIQDTGATAVHPVETYDNISVIAKTQAQIDSIFGLSKLVKAVSEVATLEPEDAAATALATGADGTIADTDYESAVAVAEQEKAGNVVWADRSTSVVKGYLKAHVLTAPDKMVIIGPDDDTVLYSTAVTEAADYRNVEGRIMYAFNPLQISESGIKSWTSPASWLASIISNTSPHIDPAYAANVVFTQAVLDIKYHLSRAKYIALKEAGICAFEQDSDYGGSGVKPKSGITTQIVDSGKVQILRRRMADFLTDSIAAFLKAYQNAPNTRASHREQKAAIIGWDDRLINPGGILPSDAEVFGGNARLVDVETLNTDSRIAAGFNTILYKRRIFSSQRYIVLQAEIGEAVVVTEVA